MIVTIDGPAGTGKSTVARTVASTLGFEYLDTGAMYRVVAWLVLNSQQSAQDAASAAVMAESAAIEFRGTRCFTRNVDVTDDIRSAPVTEAASIVAQHGAVRSALVVEQRRIAANCNIVCEGRDQGTVVFPHAECKFYLYADAAIRTQRRLAELATQGITVEYETLLQQIEERDRRDAERAIAPLRPAADAVIIDTGPLASLDVVRHIVEAVRSRWSNG